MAIAIKLLVALALLCGTALPVNGSFNATITVASLSTSFGTQACDVARYIFMSFLPLNVTYPGVCTITQGDGKPVKATLIHTIDFSNEFVPLIAFYQALSSGTGSGLGFWTGLFGAINAGCTAEAAYTDSLGLGNSLTGNIGACSIPGNQLTSFVRTSAGGNLTTGLKCNYFLQLGACAPPPMSPPPPPPTPPTPAPFACSAVAHVHKSASSFTLGQCGIFVIYLTQLVTLLAVEVKQWPVCLNDGLFGGDLFVAMQVGTQQDYYKLLAAVISNARWEQAADALGLGCGDAIYVDSPNQPVCANPPGMSYGGINSFTNSSIFNCNPPAPLPPPTPLPPPKPMPPPSPPNQPLIPPSPPPPPFPPPSPSPSPPSPAATSLTVLIRNLDASGLPCARFASALSVVLLAQRRGSFTQPLCDIPEPGSQVELRVTVPGPEIANALRNNFTNYANELAISADLPCTAIVVAVSSADQGISIVGCSPTAPRLCCDLRSPPPIYPMSATSPPPKRKSPPPRRKSPPPRRKSPPPRRKSPPPKRSPPPNAA